jgi:hypothetical protein
MSIAIGQMRTPTIKENDQWASGANQLREVKQ